MGVSKRMQTLVRLLIKVDDIVIAMGRSVL